MCVIIYSMGEIINFPGPTNNRPGNNVGNNGSSKPVVLEFRKETLVKNIANAYLSEDHPFIAVGNEIIVEVGGRKHKATVTKILSRDGSNNVSTISYCIPFLNGDDPLKFGEANFKYKIETHD